MRTTLEIEDDVLQAAKEMAGREGKTAGQIISALARKGLSSERTYKTRIRGGVPVLPSRREVITLQKIQQLMDAEGV